MAKIKCNLNINGKSKTIRHVIFKTFSLDDANSALTLMNENNHFGKLVLLTNQ